MEYRSIQNSLFPPQLNAPSRSRATISSQQNPWVFAQFERRLAMRRAASPQRQFLKSYWTASQTLCVLGGKWAWWFPWRAVAVVGGSSGFCSSSPSTTAQRTLPWEQKALTASSKCHKPGFSFAATNESKIVASSAPEDLIHVGHRAGKKNPNTLWSGQMLPKPLKASTRTVGIASWGRKHSA